MENQESRRSQREDYGHLGPELLRTGRGCSTARSIGVRRRRRAAPRRHRPAPDRMTQIVYDAGILVAADRGVRTVWADHRVRLEAGIIPIVPAPVVAQVSRSRAQVQLRRLLRGCEIVPLTEQKAHAAGELMSRAATRDVVDAVVAQTAADLRADVVTGDRADIHRLLQAADATSQIIDV